MSAPLPRYRQIAGELRARIRTGQYAPGDRLPSLAELVADYDVTVGTATKAIGVLKDEGLARKEQGKGTFVSDQLPEEARSESEQMRADIEALREKVAQLERRFNIHEDATPDNAHAPELTPRSATSR
jgi:DNA-binding GntR family transcriptional regulator